jgi:hypothetical protein
MKKVDKTMRKKIDKGILLRILSICFTVAGLITIIPNAGAHNASILGYNAVCSFAPLSTGLFLYIGITMHRYLSNVND